MQLKLNQNWLILLLYRVRIQSI